MLKGVVTHLEIKITKLIQSEYESDKVEIEEIEEIEDLFIFFLIMK